MAGARIAPVTAHSIATLNRLAPGRTFPGIGAGNTALRIMGHKPRTVADFEDCLPVVRALPDGEEVEFAWRGRISLTGLEMPDPGYMDIDRPVPMYGSGFGPKALALA